MLAAHLRTCSKGIASPLASFSAWIMLDHNEQNEFGMVVVIWPNIHESTTQSK